MAKQKTFGDLIRKIYIDKNLSCQDIAEKMDVTFEYIKDLELENSIPTQEFLQKFSGNFGIPYSKLIEITGYNILRPIPDYYSSDGKPINIDEILAKIYYKDPSILPHLYEVIFKK